MNQNTNPTPVHDVVGLMGPGSELHAAASLYGIACQVARAAELCRDHHPEATAMKIDVDHRWIRAVGPQGEIPDTFRGLVPLPDFGNAAALTYRKRYCWPNFHAAVAIDLQDADRAEDETLRELQRAGYAAAPPAPISPEHLGTLREAAEMGRQVLHARLGQDGWNQARNKQIQDEARDLLTRLDAATAALERRA